MALNSPDGVAAGAARPMWPHAAQPAEVLAAESARPARRSFFDRWFTMLMAGPALAGIVLVVVVPLVYSIWLSFTEVDLLNRAGPAIDVLGVRLPLFRFVGLENYAHILADPDYWDAFARTVYFVALFVLEATLVGFGMALVLDAKFRGRGWMRAMLLIPWSMSRIAVGILWLGMLDADFGAINGVLYRFGVIDTYISFFSNGFTALNMLVVVYVWNQAPFATILFLAGMQSISPDLYAAAAVDGAGYWRRIWHVTLPSLRPMIFLVLVLATVNGFLMLDLIYVMTSGGPGYRVAFSFYKFGPGAAILFTLTIMCVAFTVVYRKLVLARHVAE
jgi:ABC-type sugar transport system permease subunit